MINVVQTLRTFGSLAYPYFGTSEDRWTGRALAAGVIGLELALVLVAVALNEWQGRFFDALEQKSWDKASRELVVFVIITALTIAGGAAQYWLGQHFQIRWRRWMTNRLVGEWLNAGRHYRLPLIANEVDNPQLRVINDVSVFVQKTHEVGSSFIGVLAALVSFSIILWGLSARIPLPFFGKDFSFPGYLIVFAFIYAALGTLVAHLLGWRLVSLNFEQQKREADLRYAAQHAHDHGEQVALLGAEEIERTGIRRRVDSLIKNWRRLTVVQTRLNGFSAGYNQVSAIFPILIVSPAYLVGAIPLGALIQAAAAFQRVEQSFAFFISSYAKIAEWKAAMDRISGLEQVLRKMAEPGGVGALEKADGQGFGARNLVMLDAKGERIAGLDALDLKPGERLLISGASGSGKSILLRGIAGIWPFGQGNLRMPKDGRLFGLPERPYFPLGTLRQALCAPADPKSIADDALAAALADTGLKHLEEKLDQEEDWNATLSAGDQQRVGFARALLVGPALLLLDNPVSALPEEDARALYEMLARRLPEAVIISVGAGSLLSDLHGHAIDLDALKEKLAANDKGEPKLALPRFHAIAVPENVTL